MSRRIDLPVDVWGVVYVIRGSHVYRVPGGRDKARRVDDRPVCARVLGVSRRRRVTTPSDERGNGNHEDVLYFSINKVLTINKI